MLFQLARSCGKTETVTSRNLPNLHNSIKPSQVTAARPKSWSFSCTSVACCAFYCITDLYCLGGDASWWQSPQHATQLSKAQPDPQARMSTSPPLNLFTGKGYYGWKGDGFLGGGVGVATPVFCESPCLVEQALTINQIIIIINKFALVCTDISRA